MAEEAKSTTAVSTLFVGKIPPTATSKDLEEFFGEIGPLRNCFVVADKSKGKVKEDDPGFRNKGIGYVHFAVAEDAKQALESLKDVKFKGKQPLKMEFAQRKSSTKRPNTEEEAPAPKKQRINKTGITKAARLIVRNLPWKYNEQNLKELFGKHGQVNEVQLPRKFPGGPLRGFAFIQFHKVKDAEKAMAALNATEHHGRTIAVDWSLSKDRFNQVEKAEEAPAEEEKAESSNEESDDDSSSDSSSASSSDSSGDSSSDEEAEDSENDATVPDIEQEVDSDEEEEDEKINFGVDSDEEDEESNEEEGDDSDEEEIDEDEEMAEVSDEDDDEEDSEEDDSEEENSEEEDEDVEMKDAKAKEKSKKQRLPDASEGGTLFVRNLLFESTEDDLKELFKQWGPVVYARITKNKDTNLSRGNGFVLMKNKEDADKILAEVEEFRKMSLHDQDEDEDASDMLLSKREKKKKGLIYDSILTPDSGSGLGLKFTLDGRVLDITRAVQRNEASKLKEEKAAVRRKEDKRNLYLMHEGVVFPGTPAAANMSESELQKRQMTFSMRKRLLNNDPALFISKTRLSIRNLPISVDDNDLRKLGRECIQKFKDQVKNRLRTDLSAEEKEEGWHFLPRVKQAKIIRSKDRVDSATSKLRSKGYGFLEFYTHSHALAALRYLNNNPELFDGKRLIVEFSVENKDVLEKRKSQNAERAIARIKAKAEGKDSKDNKSTDKTSGKRFGGDKKFDHKRDGKPSDSRDGKSGRGRGGSFGRGRGGSFGRGRGGSFGGNRDDKSGESRDNKFGESRGGRGGGFRGGRGGRGGGFRGGSRGGARGGSRGGRGGGFRGGRGGRGGGFRGGRGGRGGGNA